MPGSELGPSCTGAARCFSCAVAASAGEERFVGDQGKEAFDCVLRRVEKKGCGGFWGRKGAVGLALGIPVLRDVLAPDPSPVG